jgi:hypothetical protein
VIVPRCTNGLQGDLARPGQLRSTELNAPSLGCYQCGLRAGANHGPLLLRKRSEQVEDERVNVPAVAPEDGE